MRPDGKWIIVRDEHDLLFGMLRPIVQNRCQYAIILRMSIESNGSHIISNQLGFAAECNRTLNRALSVDCNLTDCPQGFPCAITDVLYRMTFSVFCEFPTNHPSNLQMNVIGTQLLRPIDFLESAEVQEDVRVREGRD